MWSSRGWKRRRVASLERRGDVARLLRGVGRQDEVVDREGRAHDLLASRREEAVRALGRLAPDEALAPVADALADPVPAVRAAAVEALAAWPSRAGLDALVAWLATLAGGGDAPEATDRAFAALERAGRVDEVLVRLLDHLDSEDRHGDPLPAGVPAALDRLARHVDVTAALLPALHGARAEQAAWILGLRHDHEAVDALVGALATARPAARAAAARALGEIRDPRAVEALLPATGDADFEVRTAAQDALDRLGTVGATLAVAAAIRPVLDHHAQAEREGVSGALERLLRGGRVAGRLHDRNSSHP